ncbi:MAG: 3-methyl-2-oxobutanoate hydroxymethyltransferase [Lentisphaerae bacterium]|nr:3-methyl-2-oxobutanoate hydroxymethyltransferase [Lentisphaerota bacterium]
MDKRITVRDLAAMKKSGQKIVMITAYDAAQARWGDEAGCQILLVGDSMGNTVLGYDNTLPVTLEESLSHTAAVRRGSKRAMVIGDMPFMSYQAAQDEALHNAARYLKECGADGVKLEGGRAMLPTIRRMVEVGIPVMGHIGLLPQSVLKDGGYYIHGRNTQEAKDILDDAVALQEAGVFSVVLEGIPAELSREITARLTIPTIGIAAGPHCDGQVQVISDLLNMGGGYLPRHAKVYADLSSICITAIRQYCQEVQSGQFPAGGN